MASNAEIVARTRTTIPGLKRAGHQKKEKHLEKDTQRLRELNLVCLFYKEAV